MIKVLLYILFFILIYKILKNIKFVKNNKDDVIDAEYEEIE